MLFVRVYGWDADKIAPPSSPWEFAVADVGSLGRLLLWIAAAAAEYNDHEYGVSIHGVTMGESKAVGDLLRSVRKPRNVKWEVK